jgi:hypothetical protein
MQAKVSRHCYMRQTMVLINPLAVLLQASKPLCRVAVSADQCNPSEMIFFAGLSCKASADLYVSCYFMQVLMCWRRCSVAQMQAS